MLCYRAMMTALLQHLAQQPPPAALHTLEVLADKVLDPRQGIPAAVQGGVFGEEVLVQVRPRQPAYREGAQPRWPRCTVSRGQSVSRE